MTVRELIQLLNTMPQDALVIQTMCSDYSDVEANHITLMVPDEEGGMIRHHGHLMQCKREWLGTKQPTSKYRAHLKDVPQDTQFLTCVHFAGN